MTDFYINRSWPYVAEKWCLRINRNQRSEQLALGEIVIFAHKNLCRALGGGGKGLIHWGWLPMYKILNRLVWWTRLYQINWTIQHEKSNKRGQVVLLYDNAMPHTANIVKAVFSGFE